ncbi:hemopexin repeat-containing protein [Kitasatospora sp. NPDC048286]|uniref:hemopexin repeat-containing protein n=1 Tax=Kitasatospora sp. NPDC048286 TaxID=3364047 RepID=UPI003716267B
MTDWTPRIDAVFALGALGDHAVFFTRDDQVQEYTLFGDTDHAKGRPVPLSTRWPNLPTPFSARIDAAALDTDPYVWVFSGDQVVRYDFVKDAPDANGVTSIADSFPNLPDPYRGGIDAALRGPDTHLLYLFSGGRCALYDTRSMKVQGEDTVAATFPGLADHGPDFTTGVHAALDSADGRRYLFKVPNYIRLDAPVTAAPNTIAAAWAGLPSTFGGAGPVIDAVNSYTMTDDDGRDGYLFFSGVRCLYFGRKDHRLYDGYPRLIADELPGLPEEFRSDIDASYFDLEPGPVATVILMKQDAFVEYDYLGKAVRRQGKLADLTDDVFQWLHGLPSPFDQGIDAIGNATIDFETYAFRGDTVYNTKTDSISKTTDAFPGLPDEFRSGIDAAVWDDCDDSNPDRLWLFSGSLMLSYDLVNKRVLDGWPRPVLDLFAFPTS